MAIVPSPLLGELLTANRINRQAGAMSNPQTGTTDDKPSGTDKRRSTVGRGKCMCFYNQKRFACGDWSWTSFAHRCNYEYRTGETCGMRLVNMTENEKTNCRLCEKIETKYRRHSAEVDRLDRWKREGATLVASMDRSHKLIMELEKEIRSLQRERDDRRSTLLR
ncbi:hypothetical protein PENSOL_c087G03946 [Penicillium solitum]|uniref:Uncharacterized protein n=2 Tax=Penicillium solitum TaxID=60172 RepID=A0A1V6QB70_9EURO|nr:uncharacterized protein PENSOL_c087G03946 [Penicillium solitum]OQD86463.1 hypothetical protein PENSOL_c087G03946 [Penicillium solitum]